MRIVWGLLLLLIGVLFLADNMRWFEFDLGEAVSTYWPVVLIVLGGWMLVEKIRPEKQHVFDYAKFDGRQFKKTFGDVNLRPSAIDSAGLHVEEGIGEINLDLTQTTLATGENKVECSLGIGDIHVIVPAGIPLMATGNSGIGDVEILTNKRDGFGASLDHKDGNYDGADVKIRVFAKVGLGDVKVVR